jgi:hypothetical protein
MMDRTLPARMAASLAAALAIGGTAESYGLVLKGLKTLRCCGWRHRRGGGRLAALNHARPLGGLKRDTRGVSHSRSDGAHPEPSFDGSMIVVDKWKNLATQVAHKLGALHGGSRIASATRVCKLCRRESDQIRRALPGPSETDADVRHVQVLHFCR